jgi:hypothetical protein
MAQIGLTEAARLTGRNQTTIHRAMKTGRLSYTVDAAGARQIDTAELDRVFGILTGSGQNSFGSKEFSQGNGASLDASAHSMQSKIAHEPESERVIAAQAETIAQMDAMIRDLRARLDLEAAERRQLSERLHGLLTAPGKVVETTGFSSPGSFETKQQPDEPKRRSDFAFPDPSPSAASGLVIPRPPWWRRWFR